MKTYTKSVLISVFIFSILNIFKISINKEGFTIEQNQLFAQNSNSFWSDISESNIKSIDSKSVLPIKFRGLKLNLNSFRSNLNGVPFERSPNAVNSPFIIELPTPDGRLSKFYVTEYSMMEEGLAAQFPEIKTYNIQGIDDPYAMGKIDFTMAGFHAMVLTTNGDYFINPVSLNNTEYYTSFYKSDYSIKRSFECMVTEESIKSEFINSDLTGQQLRTYKLACAATGEYTAFFGGTVAAGQAAIVTSINRVNAIYERDLSVRMTLVSNNSSIVYTNSATDPYTNGNGSTMLGQNQTNCDAVIGTANYNIGHVFSTGGGGVAGLGVVCSAGNKARGVTGSPSPVGDPYDIDYVAHEMGHQFSGNHSFNGNAGNCSGGNRNASTAWEPGSASTIMGYAGICSPQDLQPNSDALFHSGNVSEITAFTQTGGGNACPVTTNTGNTPPTVTVPTGGFTIPISTPFALTGSATDIESPGSLTYIWEEFDLGAAGAPTAPVGNAPIFRSFTLVTSPTRTFPKLSDLLNNTSTIGEILPTYTRNLSFRLTARDNNAGGGGINFNTISFNVSSTAGPFVMTQPNTAVSWNSGVSQTVTWNVANTTAAPISCALINIKLSTDGGNTFPTTLISNTANDGSEIIVLPGVASTQARIKVESVGNVFFDISNVNFTILNTGNPVITHTPLTNTEQITGNYAVNCVITPNATTTNPALTKLFWSRNNVAITDSLLLTNTGGNNWTGNIPANGAPATYRYYIKTTDNLSRTSTSPDLAPAVLYLFVAQPDNTKPVIVHTALTDMPKASWPATVTATVTDNVGLDSAWVVWYKNTPTPTKQFKLINTSGNTFTAAFNSLNSDVVVGDNIYYKIFAKDNSIAHNMDSTSLITFKISDPMLCEDFTSATFAPTSWNIEFSGTNYWTRNAVSGYGVGTGAAKFDFWTAATATTQSLVTLTFGNSVAGDSLKFDNAYAPYTDGSIDSLEILTSTNGGTSYTSLIRLWGSNAGGTLNTVGALGTIFTPTSAQWAAKKYALPVGTNKIKFRARSGFGNNLYLDNICKTGLASPVAATITLAQEGYYDPSLNILNKKDTVRFYLRNITSPYSIVDSGKTLIDDVSLSGTMTFANANTGTYYIVVKSRNTLETWSKAGGQSYTRGAVFTYDFTSAFAQAYGSNLILKGTEHCLFSGDVNQDGTIDASDLSPTENAVENGISGYVAEDVTGDDFCDGSDLSIVENNQGVNVAAPPGAVLLLKANEFDQKPAFKSDTDRQKFEKGFKVNEELQLKNK